MGVPTAWSAAGSLEFVAVTGYHREGAMLSAGEAAGVARPSPPRRRVYNAAVCEALIVLWEASDRICGKRLHPLLPGLVDAMERHGPLQLATEVRAGILTMSAARLTGVAGREGASRRRKRRSSPPSAAVRQSVPIRTFADWDDPAPGYVEADLVAHSGPVARGSFLQTLVLTDTATGGAGQGSVGVADGKPAEGGRSAPRC